MGKDVKTICDYIWGMRIIDSSGELREYNKDKDSEVLMQAIQGNFGLFGIIYDITFDMWPQTIVEVENRFEEMEKIWYDKEYFKKTLDDHW